MNYNGRRTEGELGLVALCDCQGLDKGEPCVQGLEGSGQGRDMVRSLWRMECWQDGKQKGAPSQTAGKFRERCRE